MRGVTVRVRMAIAILLWSASAHAADCVSFVRQVSVRGVFPNRAATAIARDGGVSLVAKVDPAPERTISVATYDDDLQLLSGNRIVAPVSFRGPVALLWNGTEFGVFYQDLTTQLILQRISRLGEPIGSGIAIAPQFVATGEREYDIIWDPARQVYAMAHTVDRGEIGLWLTLIRPDGSIAFLQLYTQLVATTATPRVGVSANGVTALFYRQRQTLAIQFLLINPANAVIASGTVMTARDVRVAVRDNDFVVVGSVPGAVAPAPMEIHWAIVNANGTITQKEKTLFAGRGMDVAPVYPFWNADRQEWVLSYLDSLQGFNVVPGELRLRRFTTTGEKLSDTPFSPDTVTSTFGSDFPFVWTGQSYISTLSRAISSTQGTESFLAKHCPLTAIPLVDRRYAHVSDPVTFTGEVSGGSPDYTYTWNFGDSPRNETGRVLTHRYERTGTYTVSLRVTDMAGGTSVTTTTVYIVVDKRRAVRHH